MKDAAGQLIDELLVMEAQDGNAQAMEALISRWQKRLWQYARRLTGNAEAAWDVTQESWLGVVRGIRRLDDPARFRPWVYRIVTRKAHDWIGARVRARTQQAEPAGEPTTTAGPSKLDVSVDLESVLQRLLVRSRVVLTLYYLEDLGVSEVAQVLGLPVGTVKSRLHQARNEFKELWQQATA